MNPETLARSIPVLVAVVFVWQLFSAGRLFKLIGDRGSRLGSLPLMVGFGMLFAQAQSVRAEPPLFAVRYVAGVVLLAAAVAVFTWAARSIAGQHFTYIFSGDQPRFIWQKGPFGYVRHPFYTSYMLSQVGTAVLVATPAAFLTVACMCAYFFLAARFEERKFRGSPLAVQYAAYMSRTGRFVPKLSQPRSA